MNKALHRTVTLLSSGILALSLLAGCSDTPPASGSVQENAQAPSSSSQFTQSSQSSAASAVSQSGSSQSSEAPQSSSVAAAPAPTPSTAPTTESEGKTLVVYFSATGNTKAVAEVIAAETDGELYEIVPENPYTSEDLDWTVQTSRSSKEHEDPNIRPTIAGDAKDFSNYDTIFIGYPLWWGEAPNIVWNFVESSSLSGKTVIPFATSDSSGFGSSGDTLAGLAPDANWQTGQRFRGGVADADVQSWVDGLNLK